MSCSVCSVDPPDFWHAAISVVVIATVNIVLRFWLNVTHVPPGLGSQLLAPLVASSAVVSISVHTGPFSAVMVTLVHGLICSMCYLGATTLGSAIMANSIF